METQETKNAYEEEQETLAEETKERVELALRIGALLDDYGYDIVAKIIDGVPQPQFVKRIDD